MRMFEDGRFDFVLFSWNGLDMVGGEEERLSALREIQRVCAPGASFAFSSHNLASLRRRFSRRTARTTVLRALNPSRSKIDRMGSGLIADARRGLRPMRNFYIRPPEQLRQLEAAGFRDPVALTEAGEKVPAEALDQLDNDWLYYLCRR
jgi:ubiquinone/menaquinone biosynthesis C-methylase UbiE